MRTSERSRRGSAISHRKTADLGPARATVPVCWWRCRRCFRWCTSSGGLGGVRAGGNGLARRKGEEQQKNISLIGRYPRPLDNRIARGADKRMGLRRVDAPAWIVIRAIAFLLEFQHHPGNGLNRGDKTLRWQQSSVFRRWRRPHKHAAQSAEIPVIDTAVRKNIKRGCPSSAPHETVRKRSKYRMKHRIIGG